MKSAQEILETVLSIAGQGFPDDRAAELSALLAPDCVFRQAPSLPYGGDWIGPKGFRQMLAAMAGVVQDFGFRIDVTFYDEPNYAFLKGAVKGRTADGTFDTPIMELWTVRDGQVSEVLVALQDTSVFYK